jgi:hypothetical protein
MAAKLKIEKGGDEILMFSGFRGEDLNVIFYQNMPNLHNRYISAERKCSQKNQEYMLKEGPWVGPFQNCVRQPRPPFNMATVTKNRNLFKWPKLLYFKPECSQI